MSTDRRTLRISTLDRLLKRVEFTAGVVADEKREDYKNQDVVFKAGVEFALKMIRAELDIQKDDKSA